MSVEKKCNERESLLSLVVPDEGSVLIFKIFNSVS